MRSARCCGVYVCGAANRVAGRRGAGRSTRRTALPAEVVVWGVCDPAWRASGAQPPRTRRRKRVCGRSALAARTDHAGRRPNSLASSVSAFASQKLMSISRYIVVAVVSVPAPSRARPSPVQLAEAEVAVGDERAHLEFVGQRHAPPRSAARPPRGREGQSNRRFPEHVEERTPQRPGRRTRGPTRRGRSGQSHRRPPDGQPRGARSPAPTTPEAGRPGFLPFGRRRGRSSASNASASSKRPAPHTRGPSRIRGERSQRRSTSATGPGRAPAPGSRRGSAADEIHPAGGPHTPTMRLNG